MMILGNAEIHCYGIARASTSRKWSILRKVLISYSADKAVFSIPMEIVDKCQKKKQHEK